METADPDLGVSDLAGIDVWTSGISDSAFETSRIPGHWLAALNA
jgi:hypothetical protein